MSTKPKPEEPKTECPMCGNVWQEHTINQINGCEAILHLEVSAALGREATLQGKAGAMPPTVEICPVCNKLPDEHTEDDVLCRQVAET